MKKTNLILAKIISVFIFFAIFSAAQLKAQCPSKKEMKTFAKNFAQHIENEEIDKALEFFDPDYRAEQLERNLMGNKRQFLQEFLSAFYTKNDYIVPRLEDIEKIKIKRVKKQNTSRASVVCKIQMKNKISYKTKLSILCKKNKQLFFIGAMG